MTLVPPPSDDGCASPRDDRAPTVSPTILSRPRRRLLHFALGILLPPIRWHRPMHRHRHAATAQRLPLLGPRHGASVRTFAPPPLALPCIALDSRVDHPPAARAAAVTSYSLERGVYLDTNSSACSQTREAPHPRATRRSGAYPCHCCSTLARPRVKLQPAAASHPLMWRRACEASLLTPRSAVRERIGPRSQGTRPTPIAERSARLPMVRSTGSRAISATV